MPLSDSEMDSHFGQATAPLSDEQMDALHSSKPGMVATALKGLDSVTAAPVRAGISAAQNGKPVWGAIKNQFANMTDDAPTDRDISEKAGFNPNRNGPYVRYNPDGTTTNILDSTPSNADIAGRALGIVDNPLNLAGPVARGVGKFAEFAGPAADALSASSEASAPAIASAASRLGFKATPGMISNSKVVQGLEDSLSSSPSIAGAVVRKGIKPISSALENAAEDLVSAAPNNGTSSFQAGNSASKGVLANLGEKVNNVKMSYEPFNQELPKMVPGFEDKAKLADQIAKIGDKHIDPNEVSGVVKGLSNRIVGSESLADIEDTRKMIQNDITKADRAGDYNRVDTLTKIKDKLSDFRDSQFQKLAQESYPGPGGAAAGKQMVSEYKNAMGQHASLMNDLRDVGPLFGVKATNPRDFLESFSEIPPETVAKKLFNTNNYQALQKVQQYFPEEFDTIRGLKLQELRASSLKNPIDPMNSPVDPTKLITKINKLSPEVQSVLFGKNIQKISDMRTILGVGVPEAEAAKGMAGPFQQAADVVKYGAYKAASPNMVTRTVSKIMPDSIPQTLANTPNSSGPIANVLNIGARPMINPMTGAAAADNSPNPMAPIPAIPNGPQPNQPQKPVDAKGPTKWANDGFQNLRSHVGDDDRAMLEKYKGAMLLDPKAKNLLISASSFSPGSKPLDDIMKHLKTKFEAKK